MGHIHGQTVFIAAGTYVMHLANTLIFCLVAVVLVLRVRQYKHRLPDGLSPGACGHCGHAISDVQSLHCPGCGRDLRQVGIQAQAGLKPGHKALRVGGAMLTAAAALSSVIASVAFFICVNFGRHYPLLLTASFQQGIRIGVIAAALAIHVLAGIYWCQTKRGLSLTTQTTVALWLMAIITVGLTAGVFVLFDLLLRSVLSLLTIQLA